ncbi:MAG: peptidylprolyl isomerase [Planctomycetaceae bacterium]|jgi:foldase protein PrsA|nr:peptidylprolyl isomerase [Planctomycetaceae bacterium]
MKHWIFSFLQTRRGLAAVLAVIFSVHFATAQTSLQQRNPTAQVPSKSQPAPAARNNAASNVTKMRTFAAMPEVVAEINGSKITKQELANEALRMYGRDYLERTMIGRVLVMQECRRLGIEITQQEIDLEIEAFAKRFKMSVEKWLELMKTERGLDYSQYAADMKQYIALKKIAGQSVNVSHDEINRKLDSLYGPGVQVRQIVFFDKAKAEAALQELRTNPTRENFISTVKKKSEDDVSAATGGLIAPFRRYSLPDNPQLENYILNNLKQDNMSGVITMFENYYVIFFYERDIPAQNVNREALEQQTFFIVQEQKIREETARIFSKLMQTSKVTNFFAQPNNAAVPGQYPEIIATVNGESIYTKTLAEMCVVRQGDDILQSMIVKRVIEQECQKRNISVSNEEIMNELTSVAKKILPLTSNNQPDVNGLVAMQCREQGIEPAIYYSNVVWPMLALKKMASPKVQVTDEDMLKAYEATYGARVKVLAIFLDNEHNALSVWSDARRKQGETKLFEDAQKVFSELAFEHSVEPATKANGGAIDPISRYCGMPNIEEAAFALKTGELSEVIPFDTVNGKRYIILFCLGRTEPAIISAQDPTIKDLLHENIFDKKLAIEVEQTLNYLMASSSIDNYLTGKSQNKANSVSSSPVTATAPTNSTIR